PAPPPSPPPPPAVPTTPKAAPPMPPPAPPPPTPPLSPPVVDKPMPTAARTFRVKLSGDTGDFELGIGDHVVGRSHGNAVTIRNPQVSRQHAVLHVTETGVTIEDKKSGNGTFLNMQRVQGPPKPIASGDIVSFGSVEFTVELFT